MRALRVVPFLAVLAAGPVLGQAFTFTSGSDGSDGVIEVLAGTQELPLPPDGIIHAQSVTVAAGATLRFTPNALNTPVHLLSQGEILVAGTISVDGASASGAAGGQGGPGGFAGGNGGGPGASGGSGLGPGGGRRGCCSCQCGESSAGPASYGAMSGAGCSNNTRGATYGTRLLLNLVGGSGGGGADNGPGSSYGGGGGGGAILLASDTRVSLPAGGKISARGGAGAGCGAAGSGGAIRIVAPTVTGTGMLDVFSGGAGRLRVDSPDRGTFAPSGMATNSVYSIGSLMVVFPPVVAALELVRVAGIDVEASDMPVLITLPAGASPEQAVVLRATDFEGVVNADVVLYPDEGNAIVHPVAIDMDALGNPAEISVNVTFPINVATRVMAWTK